MVRPNNETSKMLHENPEFKAALEKRKAITELESRKKAITSMGDKFKDKIQYMKEDPRVNKLEKEMEDIVEKLKPINSKIKDFERLRKVKNPLPYLQKINEERIDKLTIEADALKKLYFEKTAELVEIKNERIKDMVAREAINLPEIYNLLSKLSDDIGEKQKSSFQHFSEGAKEKLGAFFSGIITSIEKFFTRLSMKKDAHKCDPHIKDLDSAFAYDSLDSEDETPESKKSNSVQTTTVDKKEGAVRAVAFEIDEHLSLFKGTVEERNDDVPKPE